MDILLLTLFVTSLTSPLVLCQDVDARGVSSNDKVINTEVSGQGRTIYSQRHISPHRMMHFGKRPIIEEPPTILAPQGYDLFQPGKNPYLLHFELEGGQSLQEVPAELQSVKNLLFNYGYPQYRLLSGTPQQQQQQQQQQQFLQQFRAPNGGQRLSRLMALDNINNNNNDSDNSDRDNEALSPLMGSPERAQTSSNNEDNNQEQQNSNINLNTRSSMQSSTRGNTMNLPKGFISNILYGRSSSSSFPSFATYNKKAEPKDNFFMHFGRK